MSQGGGGNHWRTYGEESDTVKTSLPPSLTHWSLCTGLKEAHGAAGKPPGNTGDVRHLVAGSDSRRTPAKGFTGEPGILLRGDKVTSRGL